MRFFTGLVLLFVIGLAGFVIYQAKVINPNVARELRDQPQGVRAQRVMLMTIDDRKTLPVNYLREGNQVFVGADGPWWRELRDEGLPVTVLIKGEVFAGQAKAVSGQPEFTKDVFKRLRPDVPKWLPDWLNGVLVVVELRDVDSSSGESTADDALENGLETTNVETASETGVSERLFQEVN